MSGHYDGRDDRRLAPRHQPPWLKRGWEMLGATDLTDAPIAPLYALWLPGLAMWWGDEAVPWSGRVVMHALACVQLKAPRRWWLMREWLDWGLHTEAPAIGAVAVVRGFGSGFVGLVSGADDAGRIIVLAAREGAAVEMLPVSPHRIISYRWPSDCEVMLSAYVMPWAQRRVEVRDAPE